MRFLIPLLIVAAGIVCMFVGKNRDSKVLEGIGMVAAAVGALLVFFTAG